MWDDGPGHGWSVDLTNHPEHTQPAEVLSPFLPGQHLCKEGENDGHSTSYPVEDKKGQRLNPSQVVLCFAFITQQIELILQSKDLNNSDWLKYKEHCWILKENMHGEVNCVLCAHDSAVQVLLTGSIGFSITLQISGEKVQLLN